MLLFLIFFRIYINSGISIPNIRLTIMCGIKPEAGRNFYELVLETFPTQKGLSVANLESDSSSELHTR